MLKLAHKKQKCSIEAIPQIGSYNYLFATFKNSLTKKKKHETIGIKKLNFFKWKKLRHEKQKLKDLELKSKNESQIKEWKDFRMNK